MTTHAEEVAALNGKMDEVLKVQTQMQRQYHLDMHGDNIVNGGNSGIIGSLRELKHTSRATGERVTKLEKADNRWKTIAGIFTVIGGLLGAWFKDLLSGQ